MKDKHIAGLAAIMNKAVSRPIASPVIVPAVMPRMRTLRSRMIIVFSTDGGSTRSLRTPSTVVQCLKWVESRHLSQP